MSENLYYSEKSSKALIRNWVFGQMVWGASIAAIVFIGCVMFFVVFYYLGLLLPEESRQTPDPMPRSSLEQPLTVEGHDLA